MEGHVEDLYFNWLCAKVQQVEHPTPSLTHWNLLRELHRTEFVWLLSGDDNRAEDGVDLRPEFARESFIKMDPDWEQLGCSLLEMLIAFSRRASFEVDLTSAEWFWEFLQNLGLAQFDDAHDITPDEIGQVLFKLIWRTYDMNGRGGLFPMQHPEHDQRHVEIWYQFCEYLVEQGMIE